MNSIDTLIQESPDLKIREIASKVSRAERVTDDDALYLFEKADLATAGILADHIRKRLHGDKVYFNRNFHVEPTNVCIYTCSFCSYSRLIKQREDGWEYTLEDILDIVRKYEGQDVTEVHIVGGVMPQYDLDFYRTLFQGIRRMRPDLHIKALTPVELHYIFKKAKVSYEEGLRILQDAGLDSLPGGGAEIFDEEIRLKISGDKCNSDEWLSMHETWHRLGGKSNATILYGHIESFAHRVDHMRRLRELQDRTGGFQTFIPLKFRNKDNEMSDVPETSVIEDLRNYAISRIYLDDFSHVKAYWPMIGRNVAQMSLSFGVDDMDGTIDDTTKIYSMAGAEEQNPSMSTYDLVTLIRRVGKRPIERDTLYGVIKDYSDVAFQEDAEYSGYLSLPVIQN